MGGIAQIFGGGSNKEARRIAEESAQRQRDLEAQLTARQAKEESDKALIEQRDASKKRAKQQAAASAGPGSTILTSPLGVVGEAKTEGRTILGA